MANENEKFNCTFIVFGEPASKANVRRLVTIRGRPAFIKSKKANDYMASLKGQCMEDAKRQGIVPTDKDLRVEMMIFYASRRPDLDESVILDGLQGIAYVNDRQVRQRMVYWGLDRDLPRAVIRISECDLNDVPDYLKDDPIPPHAQGGSDDL